MKTVKVLGSGCSKCKILEQRLSALKVAHGLEFDLIKITELDEIISYGIMMTPGLVVDGELKSVGSVPKDSLLLQWLKEQSNASA
jgi:small redox-active disulfide protein 2